MKIRSWAGGLMLSGLFYSIFIVAMSVSQWPSMHEPSVNITLTSNLPTDSQAMIYRVEKSKHHGASGDASYEIVTQEYSMKNTSPVVRLDTVHMINGHILIFRPDSSISKIEEVAKQYTEVLLEYQIQETANAIVRMVAALVIPIFTIGLFAWAGNKLWRAIETLD